MTDFPHAPRFPSRLTPERRNREKISKGDGRRTAAESKEHLEVKYIPWVQGCTAANVGSKGKPYVGKGGGGAVGGAKAPSRERGAAARNKAGKRVVRW